MIKIPFRHLFISGGKDGFAIGEKQHKKIHFVGKALVLGMGGGYTGFRSIMLYYTFITCNILYVANNTVLISEE